MRKIHFKRGFNKIKVKSLNIDKSVTIKFDIISENNIDIKIIAIKDNKIMCSDTYVKYNYLYNEVSTLKNYSTNIVYGYCEIYLCFHSKLNNSLIIKKDEICDCNENILLFDYDKFKNKLPFPTWEELVYDEIDMDYNNGFDYPLIESTYGKEEVIAMMKTLTSNKLTMGKKVLEFEKKFAKYVGSKYAIMVNSDSSANLLAMAVATNYLRENKLVPGDKVIVPNICWSTSVWPIIQMNLQPVFVDVDSKTMNMDIDDLKRKITPDVKGIVAVHILGNSTNMSELMKIVEENNLFLMEDTCESLGSKYNNKVLGTFGDFGTYSFYYSHHITTVEGGMVVCNKESDFELLKCLRAHGWTRYLKNKKELEEKYKNVDPRFLFVNVGYNFRPMEIQGAMGLVQLSKLDVKNQNRIWNHAHITKRIINDPRNNDTFSTPIAYNNCKPAWFALPFIINEKFTNKYNDFLQYLTNKKVENRPIVTGNFTRQPIFDFLNINVNPEDYKGSEILHKRGFFIGLSCEKISEERINNLVEIFFNYDFTK